MCGMAVLFRPVAFLIFEAVPQLPVTESVEAQPLTGFRFITVRRSEPFRHIERAKPERNASA